MNIHVTMEEPNPRVICPKPNGSPTIREYNHSALQWRILQVEQLLITILELPIPFSGGSCQSKAFLRLNFMEPRATTFLAKSFRSSTSSPRGMNGGGKEGKTEAGLVWKNAYNIGSTVFITFELAYG
ncbi:hypothetical protein G2W53_029475 [Senna tora]|uniref:Uncharacterized protein n=1 Tax=Senna tora TaxID=362788 RepID=A0A834T7F8_9FABA|nr:hypothetical protein G2W53_029475 [Senna tora]